MTVSSTTTSVSITGDGSTTDITVTFPFLGTGSSSELTVVERTIATGAEVTLDYSTHYTITGGNGETGTVIAGTAPASTVQWHVRRNTTATQTTDYVTNDPFAADTFELSLDRLAMLGQERDGDISQSFKFPDTYTGGASTTFPEPVANAYLLYNADADALTTTDSSAAQYLGGNGTVSLPFYSYSSDPNSGAYRIGADNIGWAVNGVKGLDLSTSGLTVTGTLAATAITGSGVLSIDDTTETTSGTSGSIHTDGGLGVAKKLHVIGTTTHGGDILSDTDSTDSLGSTGVRWLKLWVDAIQTTANIDIAGNLIVTGNLTVSGTTTSVDTNIVTIGDNIIVLNADETGTPSQSAGFEIERGTSSNVQFVWDEGNDRWTVAGQALYGTGTLTFSGGGALTGTWSDLGTVSTINIDGGSVDGAVIGGASAAAITGTTLTANTSITLATGGAMTGVLDSDAMSGASAALLSTSESIKAYVDSSSKAAGISMTWETATGDSDQGVGKVWASAGSFTPGSDYTLYFDDVERNSVSINALIDSLDDPTATNSATIYIQEAGTASAGLVFLVNGSITSASTYSKVAVEHVATFGTLTDGDVVGVTIAFSGNDGSGSGTVTQINAGAGFSFSAITSTGTIAVDGNLEDLDALGAVSSNSEMIVGTGAGAYAYESGSTLRTSIGVAIGSDVQAYDADTLKADTDDTLSGGFQYTADADGAKSTGTYTPTYSGGNVKTITGTGNFTLAPQSGDGTIIIQYTVASGSPTVSTGGFEAVTGDDITTTTGHDFMLYLTVVGAFQHLHVVDVSGT